MRIPDCVAPVVGYRAWLWHSTGLKSLNGEPWCPGRPLVATCRIAAKRRHDVPQWECTCGAYAAKSLAHLSSTGYDRYGILGEVYLWGSVVEHEKGWRAAYAYPKSFILPVKMLRVSIYGLENQLNALARYGCDIFVSHGNEATPLWVKASGYQPAGLDLLVQRSKEWYARRARERHIHCGDRVVVRGRGIAVVDYADEREIRVQLWNRQRMRMRRNHILWDEQNMRWEANGICRINDPANL